MRTYLIVTLIHITAVLASAESTRTQLKSLENDLNKQIEKSIEKPKPAKQADYSSSKQSPAIVQTLAAIEKPITENKKENRIENSLEFYIPFFGYGLKITDILMIILTGALAWYTRGLHRSTEKLWNAGEKQMKLTSESLEIVKREFNFVHRPKLTIRREQFRTDLEQIGINIVLANTGDLAASNIFGNINIKMVDSLKTSAFEKESMPIYGTTWIDIGQMIDKTRNSTVLQAEERVFIFFAAQEINDTALRNIRNGTVVLYFFGLIHYTDDSGNRRETAFFRKFSPETNKFSSTNDIDYEH